VRDTLTEINDPRIGSVKTQGVVPKLSETPGEVTHLGKAMGADTQSILKEWLDIEAAEYAELVRDSVV